MFSTASSKIPHSGGGELKPRPPIPRNPLKLDQVQDGSGPVLPLELFDRALFGFEITVGLSLVGLAIDEGGMHLRE